MLGDCRQNVTNIVPGIDDDRLARGLVTNYRAVTLQWTDGKNFVNHVGRRVLAESAAAFTSVVAVRGSWVAAPAWGFFLRDFIPVALTSGSPLVLVAIVH